MRNALKIIDLQRWLPKSIKSRIKFLYFFRISQVLGIFKYEYDEAQIPLDGQTSSDEEEQFTTGPATRQKRKSISSGSNPNSRNSSRRGSSNLLTPDALDERTKLTAGSGKVARRRSSRVLNRQNTLANPNTSTILEQNESFAKCDDEIDDKILEEENTIENVAKRIVKKSMEESAKTLDEANDEATEPETVSRVNTRRKSVGRRDSASRSSAYRGKRPSTVGVGGLGLSDDLAKFQQSLGIKNNENHSDAKSEKSPLIEQKSAENLISPTKPRKFSFPKLTRRASMSKFSESQSTEIPENPNRPPPLLAMGGDIPIQDVNLGKLSEKVEKIFSDDGKDDITDVNHMQNGQKFLRVIIMLILQRDQNLVNGSLHLLLRHFSQRQDLMTALHQVQLLVTKSHVDNYYKIRSLLEKLRTLVEKSELWVYKNDTSVVRMSLMKKIDSQSSLLGNLKLEPQNSSKTSEFDVRNDSVETASEAGSNSDYCLMAERPKNVIRRNSTSLMDVQSQASGKHLTHRNSSVFYSSNLSIVDSDTAAENYQTLKDIFDQFIRLCGSGKDIVEQQRLLRNLAVHEHVLELLKIPYDKVHDMQMKEVMNLAHSFLQKFVLNNSINQRLLSKNQSLFTGNMDERDVKTLSAIYRNNTELVFEIESSLIRRFVQSIESRSENSLKMTYIEFLKIITTCGIAEEGSTGDRLSIKKNTVNRLRKQKDEKKMIANSNQNQTRNIANIQTVVMMECCESCITDDVTCYFNDRKSYDDFKRLMDLAENTGSIDEHIKLHVCLVELLVACTMGYNIVTELKCQSLLPLEHITKILTDADVIPFVKLAYGKFLHHCYIDTENEMKEVFRGSSKAMWHIMEAYCIEVENALVEKSKSDKNHSNLTSLERFSLTDQMQLLQGGFPPKIAEKG